MTEEIKKQIEKNDTIEEFSKKIEEIKEKSKPAVVKETKKIEKKTVIELEREYTIPLRKEYLKVQKFRKAKKATKAIKEFLAKHMKVEDRDTRKVKIDRYLNEEVWSRGMVRPPTRIKVKAIKKDGIVYAELAELPEYVKFKKAKDEKRHTPVKIASEVEQDKKEEVTEDNKETKEKEKASQEVGKAAQKESAKTEKHSTKARHEKKTRPKRKTLKK